MTNPSLPRIPLLLLLAGLSTRAETPPDFAHRVAPVLREHCADCHMGAKKKGGLSMNTRDDLLKGGEKDCGDGPIVVGTGLNGADLSPKTLSVRCL